MAIGIPSYLNLDLLSTSTTYVVPFLELAFLELPPSPTIIYTSDIAQDNSDQIPACKCRR